MIGYCVRFSMLFLPPPLPCSSMTDANLGTKLEKKKGRKKKYFAHTFWFSGAPFPSPQDSKTVSLLDFSVACALLQFLTRATLGRKLGGERGKTKGNSSCLPQRWFVHLPGEKLSHSLEERMGRLPLVLLWALSFIVWSPHCALNPASAGPHCVALGRTGHENGW